MQLKRNSAFAAAASALAITLAGPAMAQELLDIGEVVVTPNRTPTDKSKVGSTVETVEEEEIERQSLPVISDYLNQIPGIAVSTQGGPGKETSLTLRGADKKYIKTLFNGIDISDPSATQVQPSFEHLLSDGVSRIEVLKGSQSTLYGSDAVAGVIGISTLPGDEPGARHRIGIEGGSHETGRAAYGFSNVTDDSRFALDLAGLYSGGISAALANGNPLVDDDPSRLENDFYRNMTGSVAGEYAFNDVVSIFGAGLIIRSEGDFDDSGLPPRDNAINTGDFAQTAGRAGFNLNLMDGRFRNTFSAQLMELDRNIYTSSVFDFGGGPFRSDFEGNFRARRGKLDYQGAFDLTERITLQWGADYEAQQAWITNNFGTDTDDEANIAGLWSQIIVEPIRNLTLTAGARHDSHSEFGGFQTYRGTVAYLFEDTGTKLRASAGTGFRAPSLYEINYVSFDPSIPATDLRPEESVSFDIGVDQSILNGRGTASLTYFQLDTDNLIDYDFIRDTYVQLPGKTRRNGVELALAYDVNEWLTLGGSYTHTRSVQADGERRPRVPAHMFGLSVAATPWEKWEMSASAKIALDAVDIISPSFGSFDRVPLDDYVLVNAKVSYKPTEATEVYLRAENLLNQKYQTVRGYGTPGISAYAGFKATF